MSDAIDQPAEVLPVNPGERIRLAREARGWSLSHVAVLLKLSERRLQAFEAGRWEEVGDRTFVRALAKSLCRHLSIDAESILLALPQAADDADAFRGVPPSAPARLAVVRPLAGARRRASSGFGTSSGVSAWLARPTRLAVVVILMATATLALWPAAWWPDTSWPTAEIAVSIVEPPASVAASAPASSPTPSASEPTVASATSPSQPSSPGTAASVSPPAAVTTVNPATLTPAAANTAGAAVVDDGLLRLSLTAASWVQVTDAQGQVLVSRLVPAGERMELSGAKPLTLRVGNASGVQAQWRGRPVDLDSVQRANVAQVVLP